jgi:hypothetical protein
MLLKQYAHLLLAAEKECYKLDFTAICKDETYTNRRCLL